MWINIFLLNSNICKFPWMPRLYKKKKNRNGERLAIPRKFYAQEKVLESDLLFIGCQGTYGKF